MTNHTQPKKELSFIAFIAIMLIVFVAGLDHSIINIALPVLGSEFNIDQNGLQWIVVGYTVSFTAGLLIAGRLSDRFGRKKMLLLGSVIFLISSIYCALSVNAIQLIIGRIAMGVGGTFLLPGTLAVITALSSEDHKPKLIGFWSGVFGMGVAIGPLVGGLLLDRFDWNSIFWINVPILTLAIGFMLTIPETYSEYKPRVHIFDGILSALAFGSIIISVIEGPGWGLVSPKTLGLGLGGLVLLVWFIIRQKHINQPILDLSIFRIPAGNVSVAIIVFFMAVFAGITFLVVLHAGLIAGFSAFQTGLMFVPVSIGFILGSTSSAAVQQGHSTKMAINFGTILVLTGFLPMAIFYSVDLSPWWVSGFLFVATLGLGMSTAAATTTITDVLPKHEAGMASAVNDLSREIGGSLGVALFGSLAAWYYGNRVSNLVSEHAQNEPLSTAIKGGLTQIKALPSDMVSDELVTATDSAFVSGSQVAFILAIIIVVILLVFTLLRMPSINIRKSQNESKGWFHH